MPIWTQKDAKRKNAGWRQVILQIANTAVAKQSSLVKTM
jgi:hypothetical protein